MNITTNRRKINISDKYSSVVLPLILLLSDYLAVLIAEATAYFLRSCVFPLYNGGFNIPGQYLYVFVPGIFLLFLYSYGTHMRRMPFWETASKIFYAVLYSLVACITIMYFGGMAGGVSRLYIILLAIFAFIYIAVMRYLVKRTLNAFNIFQEPVIFIGAGKTAELILKFFNNDTGFGYKIIGIIDDQPVSEVLPQRFRILGSFAQAHRIIRLSKVQNVIIAAPGLPKERLIELIDKIQPHVKNISFVPDLIGAPIGNLEVERLVDEKILLLKIRNNLARPYNRFLKRVFDLICASAGLIFVIPLCALIAVAIRLDSPGPAVFAHQRVGKQGRMFPCYKFRTMVPNAEKILQEHLAKNPQLCREWEVAFKLKNDPRVTKIGHFLRRTSLDELPQIYNVLRGQMSLVGPRPIIKKEIIRYGDNISDYYLVPPGITGLWQVNGRSDTTYQERVSMDSWYVRNWSVWIDIIYLLKTAKIVLTRKGAY